MSRGYQLGGVAWFFDTVDRGHSAAKGFVELARYEHHNIEFSAPPTSRLQHTSLLRLEVFSLHNPFAYTLRESTAHG